MATTRDLITKGLAQRAEAGIKTRQPLSKATITTGQEDLLGSYGDILKEELNVKEVEFVHATSDSTDSSIKLSLKLSEALKQEGLCREVIRQVQNARKLAKLEIDNRIHLNLKTEDKVLEEAIKAYSLEIKQETLARSLSSDSEFSFETTVKVEAKELIVSLEKA